MWGYSKNAGYVFLFFIIIKQISIFFVKYNNYCSLLIISNLQKLFFFSVYVFLTTEVTEVHFYAEIQQHMIQNMCQIDAF